MLKWLWLSTLIIISDQLTKVAASHYLTLHDPVPVTPFFNLTLMHNTGAAFSFLSDAGGWQRWFFTVLAIAVSGAIVYWLKNLSREQRWQAASLALILGGAIGNVIDRVRLGYVVDFIQLYYESFYWPAFNIADSAITVGAVIFVATGLFQPKETHDEADSRRRRSDI